MTFPLPPGPPYVTRQRISVVIPCYNSARFLAEALRSVREQARPVDEVIVVDDASTDGSAELARDAGVTCISLDRNGGPGAARNTGIAQTTGDLVAFLDADDYWMPTHIADVAGLLESHPESVVAFSRIRRFGEEDVIAPPQVPEGPPSYIFWQLIEENIVAQSSAVVRRDTLLRHGSYDASLRYSEDYELWLRLSRRYPFVCTSEVTAGYRVHPGQASRNIVKMVAGRWRVKHGFWKAARQTETPAFVAQLESQMRRAFAQGLQTAWDERNETHIRALLAVHKMVPGGEKIHREWTRRYLRSWRLWLAMGGAWERLLPSVRHVVRPFLSMLLGSTEPRTPLPDYLPPPEHDPD
ncbi:MAG: glycosyltransferase [Gemmatimonadota bacterium]